MLMCSSQMDIEKNGLVEEIVSKNAFQAVEKLCRVRIISVVIKL